MKNLTESWSELYDLRKQIRKRFPVFWRLPLIKKPFDVLSPYLSSGIRILDVGSANRKLEKKFNKMYPDIRYKSMDIDKTRYHDYYSLADIKEKFELIVLYEVIEHLDFEPGVDLLKRLKELLTGDGRLILTTPNVFHPNRYWEYSHKVSYRYDEISSILLALGYNVKHIYRIYNDAFFKRLFRVYLLAPVHYYFNIDFVRSIAIVAKNA